MSKDWKRAEVRLRLNFWTRNYVGTIFGGSQFSALDPFPMIQLLHLLGTEYVIWDKAGKIEFKKPGKGRLTACVEYSDEEIQEILSAVSAQGRTDYIKVLEWRDEDGDLVSVIEKTLYIATKSYYKNRPKKS